MGLFSGSGAVLLYEASEYPLPAERILLEGFAGSPPDRRTRSALLRVPDAQGILGQCADPGLCRVGRALRIYGVQHFSDFVLGDSGGHAGSVQNADRGHSGGGGPENASGHHAGRIVPVCPADVRGLGIHRGDGGSVHEAVLPESDRPRLSYDRLGISDSAILHASVSDLHAFQLLWTGFQQTGASPCPVAAGRRGGCCPFHAPFDPCDRNQQRIFRERAQRRCDHAVHLSVRVGPKPAYTA